MSQLCLLQIFAGKLSVMGSGELRVPRAGGSVLEGRGMSAEAGQSWGRTAWGFPSELIEAFADASL